MSEHKPLVIGCTGTEASFYPELAFLYQGRQIDIIQTGGSPIEQFINPFYQHKKSESLEYSATQLQLNQISHCCQEARLEQYLSRMDGLILGFSLSRPRDYDSMEGIDGTEAELSDLKRILSKIKKAEESVKRVNPNHRLSILLVGILPTSDDENVEATRTISLLDAEKIATVLKLPYNEFYCNQKSLDNVLEVLLNLIYPKNYNCGCIR